MNCIRIGSLNVRGLCNLKFRQKLLKWFEELKLDIIFLQETYCRKKFAQLFNSS